ncbi:MAG: cysteine hydrolase [Actinobacteria bacterium]|nr:MAG: cysteine hydrolase [Actinomycetota bacterium]
MGRTALLIIDMQNDIAHQDGGGFIPDAAHKTGVMAAIVDAFREAREPVIHVVRSYRTDTWDVERFRVPPFQAGRGFLVENTWGQKEVDRLLPEPGEPVVVKQRFSAFSFTELDLLLRRAGVTKIVVVGVNLPNCPRTTMYDAVGLDYDVVAVADALATTSDETHRVNLQDLAAIGVRIATAEEIIREVGRAAERLSSN